MKIICIFIVLISLLSIISCSKNETNEISANEIINKTIESKYYKITYNTVLFKKDNELISVVNDSINSFVKTEIRVFINSIDNDIKNLIDNNEVSEKCVLNIITEHYITSYGFVSTIIKLYYNTLGVHGNSVFKSINYDIINNKFINFTDLVNFKNGNLRKFNLILKKYFVNNDSCFSEKPIIDVNFNTFTIQEDSISIYFTPNNLGTYACGGTQILIPINELP